MKTITGIMWEYFKSIHYNADKGQDSNYVIIRHTSFVETTIHFAGDKLCVWTCQFAESGAKSILQTIKIDLYDPDAIQRIENRLRTVDVMLGKSI